MPITPSEFTIDDYRARCYPDCYTVSGDSSTVSSLILSGTASVDILVWQVNMTFSPEFSATGATDYRSATYKLRDTSDKDTGGVVSVGDNSLSMVAPLSQPLRITGGKGLKMDKMFNNLRTNDAFYVTVFYTKVPV